MPRRGIRIKINPHNRFDLSHLSPDEANQTLRHILQDLCFWGSLPAPTATATATATTTNNNIVLRTPQYYQSQFSEIPSELLRCQSSGSESRSSRGVSSQDNNSTDSKKTSRTTNNDRPPRNQPQTRWKTAIDTSSGQTYYYDPMTRQTQWEKPEEIRVIEKQQRKEKRKRDKVFFTEMEQNMRSHFTAGRLTKEFTAVQLRNFVGGPPKEPLALQVPSKQQRIRTISAMDEHILAQVNADGHAPAQNNNNNHNNPTSSHHLPKQPSPKRTPPATTPGPVHSQPSSGPPGRPPLPSSRVSSSVAGDDDDGNAQSSPDNSDASRNQYDHWDSLELSPDNTSAHANIGSPELEGMRLLDEPYTRGDGHAVEDKQQSYQQGHMRRNTSNTMFVNSTMTSPDIQGSIRCVCGVYRAHIVQSVESPHSPASVVPVGSSVINPDVFRDDCGAKLSAPQSISQRIPSLAEIESFYKEFFRRSQMEHDTIIMSLIYIERLVKRTEGGIRPTPLNWRSMLFSCMILASKVWDDLSMWNIDFSNVSVATGLSSFTIQRINQLEIALLSSLRFDVRVPASEYAKYYFLIRTMLFRSGHLCDESSQNIPPTTITPAALAAQSPINRRTRSVDWNAEPLLPEVKLEQLLKSKVF